MAILYDRETGLITLQTEHSTYQMLADEHHYLLHLYYGRKIEGSAAQILSYEDRGFSSNPQELGGDRTYSLDQLPQEFPFRGSADFRTPAFRMRNADGSYGCDLRFGGLTVRSGKYNLPGLPASLGSAGSGSSGMEPGNAAVQTLDITLTDDPSGTEIHLLYGVFEKADVITRAVTVTNRGSAEIVVEKAASCTLEFAYGNYAAMSFYGRHAMERNVQVTRIGHGRYSVASLRGASSHFYNPFIILKEEGTDEDAGSAWGIHLMYSGNFLAEAEKSGYDQTRFVMGLNDEEFSWVLEPGETFTAPECIMAFSGEGLGLLSNRMHRFIRDHVIHGPWQYRRRPVLINNWEATYFHFDEEKLLSIARKASELGVEMLVLDDGWFGKRESDTTGLGDWKVNTQKLGGSMGDLSDKIHSMGMKFGLWFEPEMVSEDSDLYRAHPDWVLRIPGRSYSRGRDQLVLDFARKEIVDGIFSQMTAVLDHAGIDYVKWDMNRNLTDVFSSAFPEKRQGEILHRYTLGVYDLLQRLNERYPDMLMEGCSGGGGRFDTGMLYYTPQIWCSDNTDAADRCIIQYGTSFGYPPSAMGAHVSKAPNDQTGRVTPFATRAYVAMAGTFGYELDLNRLSEEEMQMVPAQIRHFEEDYEVTHAGDYYRLSDPTGAAGEAGILYSGSSGNGAGELAAWMCVSEDRDRAVVTAVQLGAHANPIAHYIRLKGLNPSAVYHCREDGTDYSGSVLMNAGYRLPNGRQYDSWQLHFDAG